MTTDAQNNRDLLFFLLFWSPLSSSGRIVGIPCMTYWTDVDTRKSCEGIIALFYAVYVYFIVSS